MSYVSQAPATSAVDVDYTDYTEDSTTSDNYENMKTRTIAANTFTTWFRVDAHGYYKNNASTAARGGDVRITVGGTKKANIGGTGWGAYFDPTDSDDVYMPWHLSVTIKSTDADWTPTASVIVNVDGKTNTTNEQVFCEGFSVVGD